jgi:hypothetical protein
LGNITVAFAGTVARKPSSALVLSPLPQPDGMLVGRRMLCPAPAGTDVESALIAPINTMVRHSMRTSIVRGAMRVLM